MFTDYTQAIGGLQTEFNRSMEALNNSPTKDIIERTVRGFLVTKWYGLEAAESYLKNLTVDVEEDDLKTFANCLKEYQDKCGKFTKESETILKN